MDGPLEPSFETAVEEDIYQYWTLDHAARSELDATLTAFAQLAALRLDATRAIISLFDDITQYVLSEATRDSSLIAHSSHDHQEPGLLLGHTTLPRWQGVCGHALHLLTAQKADRRRDASVSPLVVSDLSRDLEFRDLPLVMSNPSLRFYAAAPISTKSGLDIGILSIIDERPRVRLTDVETQFLSDMALTIMAHLEMTRSNERHTRSVKMIKGLGDFVEARTKVDWWLELGNIKLGQRHGSKGGFEAEGAQRTELDTVSKPYPATLDELPMPSTSIATRAQQHFTAQASQSSPVLVAEDEPDKGPEAGRLSLPFHSPLSSLLSETATDAHLDGKCLPSGDPSGDAFALDFRGSLISESIKAMLAQASHLIQESIEVDGVMFLEASVSTYNGQTGSSMSKESEGLSPTSTNDIEPPVGATRDHHDDSDVGSLLTESKVHNGADMTCAVLGIATAEDISLDGADVSPLTEAFLQHLLQKYPHGHVFLAEERRQLMPSAQGTTSQPQSQQSKDITARRKEAAALRKLVPGMRSIAFIPLWDSHRERWFAGSFMWTSQQRTRILTVTEDLNYLSAFGNSIMAEVARLNVEGANRAKSDFISSVSHELRSPLHGILVSVEFLQDTTVDLFQNGMLDTIERCGRTLLDTLQHVLDFAKINNFNTSEGKEGNKTLGGSEIASETRGLNIDVDLSLLTEEVVDSVFAGHQSFGGSYLSQESSADCRAENMQGRRRERRSESERIDVILDIGWRRDWTFNTQSGALRRVLMNLFGNALKFTSSGWIKVSLQAKDIDATPLQPKQSIITITVSDSGRGIGRDYLHSDLFTPFTQEDPMNPGTGLGLSIVLQIVRSLRGTVHIASKEGVGTEVVVTLTLHQAASAPLLDHENGENIIQSARDKSSGLTIGFLDSMDEPKSSEKRADSDARLEQKLLLQTSIETTASDWFHMKVQAPLAGRCSPPGIYIANERSDLLGAITAAPTIVLCSHQALYRDYTRRAMLGGGSIRGGLVHFVSKPCGPHKLAKALAFCLDSPSPLTQASSVDVASGILGSPQSLFQKSPEEHVTRAEFGPRQDYFGPLPPSAITAALGQVLNATPAEKRKPVVLLVEDNEINMRLLSTFVKKSKYEYDTADNGLKALQAFENAQRPYDVVFMDISMPVMDGITATREIRKLERSRGQQPATIIALTGLNSATSQQDAFANGMSRYLTKPVRFSELRKILSDWTPDLAPQSGGDEETTPRSTQQKTG